jgi:hypothetical protein
MLDAEYVRSGPVDPPPAGHPRAATSTGVPSRPWDGDGVEPASGAARFLAGRTSLARPSWFDPDAAEAMHTRGIGDMHTSPTGSRPPGGAVRPAAVSR